MLKLYRLYFLLLLPLAFSSQTNTKKVKKAYADFDYYKVISMAGQLTSEDLDAMRQLADSYKRVGNYSQAEKMFEAIANDEKRTAEDVYNYSQILKVNAKYKEASKAMEDFAKLAPEDSRVDLFELNKLYYEDLLKDKKQFAVWNIAGNSQQQDFGISYYKNKLMIISSRQPLGYLTHVWNGNRLPYVDIYTCKVTDKKELKSVRKFPAYNKKYHDGPVSFNAKGNYMIFSADNYNGKNKDGVRCIRLYEGKYEKGEWLEQKALPFNSDNYSCGHPCLSADGNTLYFASDMPGGYGKTDIYKSTRNSNGNWSRPQNLGDNINTEGDEMFPFMHASGLFFFSSNGRPGMGDLDVFVAQSFEDFFSKAQNVGTPANSTKDDFAMILDAEKKHGYFSSNRDGGKGNDDVYGFDLLKPFDFGKMIKGTITDSEGNPIHEAAVFLTSRFGKVLDKVCTKKDGTYVMFVSNSGQYRIEAKKEDYYERSKRFTTAVPENTVAVDLVLDKVPEFTLLAYITDNKTKTPLENVKVTFTSEYAKVTSSVTPSSGMFKMGLFDNKLNDSLRYTIEISKSGYVTKTIEFRWKLKTVGDQKIHEMMNVNLEKVELGGDLAKMSNLGNIYFDLAKFNIRPDAAKELDKIVKIMNENPDMVVELGAHTDCRSGKAANLKLSDKRAKASVDYIKQKITNPSRISGKGYGESKLLNNCACEGPKPSPCSEEEHAINRRTEFIILKIGN